jgi:RNA recognition motif-containing protein
VDSVLAEQHCLDNRLVDVKRAVPGERTQEKQECTWNKIFVGGLPQDVGTEDLKAHFGVYGPIADAVVMMDRRTSRSRGFGFVRFGAGARGVAAADACVGFRDHRMGGKWIEVKRATPQDVTPEGSVASPSSPEDTSFKVCTNAVEERLVLPPPAVQGGQRVRGQRRRRRREDHDSLPCLAGDALDSQNENMGPGIFGLGSALSFFSENDPSHANIERSRRSLTPMKVPCREFSPWLGSPAGDFTRDDFLKLEVHPWHVTPTYVA